MTQDERMPTAEAAEGDATRQGDETRPGDATWCGGAPIDEVPTDGPARVAVTPAAVDLLRTITARDGPVMFHQSGGCCDGSAPMCYPAGEFLTGDADVHLGDLNVPGLDPIPVWIGRQQWAAWRHTRLTIDAVPGRGAGFSLEGPEGMRFLTRSRLFTDDERAALDPDA